MAARLCYYGESIDSLEKEMSKEKCEKLVQKLLDMSHDSPLEHTTFTFGIEGVSRSLTHQLVRHRIGCSYSQQSQRYVKLEQFEYVIPPAIKQNPIAKEVFMRSMKDSQTHYNIITNELIKDQIIEYWSSEGVPVEISNKISTEQLIREFPHNDILAKFEKKAIEDARYVFPNACETKIIVTMNARSLMNFFAHRCCKRAQWEIIELANEMLRLCREISPILFAKTGANCETTGKCSEGVMCCGNPYPKRSA